MLSHLIRRFTRLFAVAPRRLAAARLELAPLEERVTPAGSYIITQDGPVNEGGIITFTIEHTGVSINDGVGGHRSSIHYDIGPVSAYSPTNYDVLGPASGNFEIPDGGSQQVLVQTHQDGHYSGPLTLIGRISNAIGGTITQGSARATIMNIDPLPPPTVFSVSASSSSVEEGHAGDFVITRSGNMENTVSVTYLVNGVCPVGSAYHVSSGYSRTIEFGPNMDSWTIPFTTDENILHEPNRAFHIGLTGSTGGSRLGISRADVTITDDDLVPSFTVSGVPVTMPRGGSAFVNVDLSNPSIDPVQVFVSLTGNGGPGDVYLIGAPSGIVFFPPRATNVTLQLNAHPNADYYGYDQWHLDFTAKRSATGAASYSISVGDSGLPVVSMATGTRVVQAKASEQSVTFVATIPKKVRGPLVVKFRTFDAEAQAGVDYIAASGSVTIPEGQKSTTITIVVKGTTKRGRGARAFGIELLPSSDYILGGDVTSSCLIVS